MENNQYTIIQDTREQYPIDFSFYGFNQIVKKLDTGDYSIIGYEDKLCIERKRTTGELAINIGSKSSNFYKELERMRSYPYKYIVCEFPEDHLNLFPSKSGIPTYRHNSLRISKAYLLSCVAKIQADYDVEIIFAGTRDDAQSVMLDIFNKVIEDNGYRQPVF